MVAAGNNRTSLRSPATADGAYVVPATDLTGAKATYCMNLVLGPASGATPRPVARRPTRSARTAPVPGIYGTSFAAGFVSGALLA